MANITYGTFFLFASSVVFGIVFTWFLIPETKGISLEDMDTLFSRSGLPRTWRKQLDEIIEERRAAGDPEMFVADEKEHASHRENN